MKTYLAIDQGTTSSRAIVFDTNGNTVSTAHKELTQIYPNDGWLEHDPEEIWSSTLSVTRKAISEAISGGYKVCGIGITNQRETSIIWDRSNGKPIYKAIVWQDRRTSKICEKIHKSGKAQEITKSSGLLIDPYFSATKISWILDNVPGARKRAEIGELAFGTVESFLIWRLTGGKKHISDATNASRTSLYNIENGDWDDSLLSIFNVPKSILPEVVECAGLLGQTTTEIGYSLPILSAIGDQQSAAIGQACTEPGEIKATFGTGCFVILNTGEKRLHSNNRLISTIGLKLDGKTSFALEGSIFNAGTVVQWLRDDLKVLRNAKDSANIANSMTSNHGVYIVPAFTGLGAPWWDPDARGAIYGITRDTSREHFIRAALESVAYQTNDLFNAMSQDGIKPLLLKVDGGMSENNWLMQFLSNILGISVERPKVLETTALGAAMLAALADGCFSNIKDASKAWHLDARFTPTLLPSQTKVLTDGWSVAVKKTLFSSQ